MFGVDVGFKNCLGSTPMVEQLSFSIIPSILTFRFDLILGSFLTFWGPNGYVVEQLLVSMFSSIVTFDSDLILGP